MYILDKRLSLKAKGLLTVLLELQDAKKPLMPYSVYPTSDMDITINSAMIELRNLGYVTDVCGIVRKIEMAGLCLILRGELGTLLDSEMTRPCGPAIEFTPLKRRQDMKETMSLQELAKALNPIIADIEETRRQIGLTKSEKCKVYWRGEF